MDKHILHEVGEDERVHENDSTSFGMWYGALGGCETVEPAEGTGGGLTMRPSTVAAPGEERLDSRSRGLVEELGEDEALREYLVLRHGRVTSTTNMMPSNAPSNAPPRLP